MEAGVGRHLFSHFYRFHVTLVFVVLLELSEIYLTEMCVLHRQQIIQNHSHQS